MTKYDPFYRYLKGSGHDEVTLTFSQIEAVIGDRLPKSKKYPAFWANERDRKNSRHVHSNAWMDAGYKAFVDLGNERVTFRK